MSLKNLTEKMNALQEQIKAEARKLLQKEFEGFFDKHPNVLGFTWTQYTPYFNDGEPCEFSRHEFRVVFDTEKGRQAVEEGDLDPEAEDNDIYEMYELYRRWNPKTRESEEGNYGPFPEDNEAICAFVKSLSEVSDEIYKVLGEGQVLVTREGLDVEDYDHS